MRIRIAAFHWVLGIGVAAALWLPVPARAGLGLHAVIPLPGVRGPFGGLAVDARDERLFVCVAGENEVLVINLATGTVTNRLTGLDRPRGIVYLSASARVAVSNTGSGELDFYQADDLVADGAVSFGASAGDLVYAAGRVYSGYANGASGGIAVVSAEAEPLHQFALREPPAGFAVDHAARRLYVNLPAQRAVEIFDLADGQHIASWALGSDSGKNSAMTLDAAAGRLFIASDDPDRILVLDTASGRIVQSLPAPANVGTLDYDGATHELYAAGGLGRLVIYGMAANGRMQKTDELPTVRGANHAVLDAAQARYYLAVPARGQPVAEIRVYNVDKPDAGDTP